VPHGELDRRTAKPEKLGEVTKHKNMSRDQDCTHKGGKTGTCLVIKFEIKQIRSKFSITLSGQGPALKGKGSPATAKQMPSIVSWIKTHGGEVSLEGLNEGTKVG
jgi:hypothetical protein